MNDDDSRPGDDVLEVTRSDVNRSIEDLHRLTERVKEQNVALERLEVLVSELLPLLSRPAVVVDADGLIVAVSCGPHDHGTPLSRDLVGKHARSALPEALGRAIVGATQSHDRPSGTDRVPSGGADGARWVHIDRADVVALPGGWALATLS